MKIGIHANVCDSDTTEIASALNKPLLTLGNSLEGEYGGFMEHLWIDLELLESRGKQDGKARFPFRFQKRASGRSHFGLPATQDKFNVGHYSVRPNFTLLHSMSIEQAVPYILSLIYESTALLAHKQKKLGGFDAGLFRNKFRNECVRLGYELRNLESDVS